MRSKRTFPIGQGSAMDASYQAQKYANQFGVLRSARETRDQFSVDHGLVHLDWGAIDIINSTQHWAALMSHQKETGVWKGLLKVELDTPDCDAAALKHLDEMDAR